MDDALDLRSITASLRGSDVVQVFVHSALSVPNRVALSRLVPGLRKRPERALLLAGPRDVVCVNDPVDGAFFDFVRDMGMGPAPGNVVVAYRRDVAGDALSLPERVLRDPVVIDAIAARIGGSGRPRLHPHLASPTEFELAARLGSALGRHVEVLGGNPDIVHRAYHKHVVREKALELGVPVAPGEVVELPVRDAGRPAELEPLQAAVERQVRRTGRAIIRGACGSAGSSTFIVRNRPSSIRSALAAVAERDDNRVYLVDAMLEVMASPNIQVFIEPDRGGLSCVSVADQRLDASLVYRGNVHPSSAEMLPQMVEAAMAMGEWLRSEGLTGLCGFDFIEYCSAETGRREFLLTEANPRINAVTYPKVLMEHFGQGGASRAPAPRAFLSAKMGTTARSFSELRRRYDHLFFDPALGRGLFPYYVGHLEAGYFAAAFLGRSRRQVERMHGEFEALLASERRGSDRSSSGES